MSKKLQISASVWFLLGAMAIGSFATCCATGAISVTSTVDGVTNPVHPIWAAVIGFGVSLLIWSFLSIPWLFIWPAAEKSKAEPAGIRIVPLDEALDWSKLTHYGPYTEGDVLQPGQFVATVPPELDRELVWAPPGEVIAITAGTQVIVSYTE